MKNSPICFQHAFAALTAQELPAIKKGAKIYHLKRSYGFFLPDLDNDLGDELAENLVKIFDYCGFDMLYFDGDAMTDTAGMAGAWYFWLSGSGYTMVGPVIFSMAVKPNKTVQEAQIVSVEFSGKRRTMR